MSLVDDDQVQRALDFLRDTAEKIGEAARQQKLRDDLTKHVLALEMAKHNEKPLGAQEREARASPAYRTALEEAAAAAGEYRKILALREAAAAKIEVWRTASANYRSMKIG